MLEAAVVFAFVAVIVLVLPRVISGTKESVGKARKARMKRHLDWVNPQPRRKRSRKGLRA